jgi:hypothetical protein
MMKKIADSAVMTARYGTFTINEATTKEINFYGLHVDADAVIVLKDTSNTDVTDDYVSDPTEPIKAGTLILVDEITIFKEIEVVSGQVTLIKTRKQ